MRPRLATQADQDALWAHLDSTIDCIATDHAPHTLAEKAGPNPLPGVAGLETALPLMLTAVRQGRLTLERLVQLMSITPRQLFGLPDQPDTTIEVDAEASFIIANERLHTRCGWTPFAGMTVYGLVRRVVLRGEVAYDAGPAGRVGRAWHRALAAEHDGARFLCRWSGCNEGVGRVF